jgi:hypothetical protein
MGLSARPAGLPASSAVASTAKEEAAMLKEKVNGKERLISSGRLTVMLLLCLMAASPLRAQTTASAKADVKDRPYEVEYYYKAQWGHADEWLALFRKNHLPLLKALKDQGRILEIQIDKPRYHATEDGRWDYRVTLTWKNITASIDSAGEPELIRKLFPDQVTFKREEQRRFEILLGHWDLPIEEVSLEP